MTVSEIVGALGALAIIEAVLAMLWKKNDRRWYAQVVRGLRIAGGIIMVVIAYE